MTADEKPDQDQSLHGKDKSKSGPPEDHASSKDDAASNRGGKLIKEQTKEKAPVASVGETFSFARTQSTKLQIVGAGCFAILSGVTFPGM